MAQVWGISPNEARTLDEERRNRAEEEYLESIRSEQARPIAVPVQPIPASNRARVEDPNWSPISTSRSSVDSIETPESAPVEIPPEPPEPVVVREPPYPTPSPKITVRNGSGFNPVALLLVAIGGMVVYVAVKGTWRNIIALFQSTPPAATTPGGVQCTPGNCPPGFCSIDTVSGPKCVPMKVP